MPTSGAREANRRAFNESKGAGRVRGVPSEVPAPHYDELMRQARWKESTTTTRRTTSVVTGVCAAWVIKDARPRLRSS